MQSRLTLLKALEWLDQWDAAATIYATKPWEPPSLAAVAIEGEDAADQAARAGMVYLLQVLLARDVCDTWSEWRGGRLPTPDEKVDAVVHYATFDAYLGT